MRRASAFYILLALGLILILAGIRIGTSSHQVTYKRTGGIVAHYLSDGSYGYLQLQTSSTLYLLDEKDFNPEIHGISTIVDGQKITMFYDPGDITHIDAHSTMGTHLVGNAYKVTEITLIEGKTSIDYITPQYRQGDHMVNNWGLGTGVIVIGLILTILCLYRLKNLRMLPQLY
jgi:hypothetical protein